MSGAGRKSGYRKGVTQDVLYGEPEPEAGEVIVQVQSMRGSNLFEIITPEGKTGLAMLPTKYRKLIWIRRGDFLIVAEASGKNKGAVNFSVEHILYKDQIKHLKKKNLWPEAFNADANDHEARTDDTQTAVAAQLDKLSVTADDNKEEESESDEDDSIQRADDPMLFVNRNRMGGHYVEEDDDDSDEE